MLDISPKATIQPAKDWGLKAATRLDRRSDVLVMLASSARAMKTAPMALPGSFA